MIYRSFQLDPHVAKDVDYDIYDNLVNKYQMSREQAMANCANIAQQAKQLGLDYHFDTLVITNTFDAHRLTLFAAKKGRMDDMVERLFKALFTESKHIGDQNKLIQLATEVGLDSNEVKSMLAGEELTQEVRLEQEEASKLGIHAVPFYVFNRKFAVSGAQPSEVFANALEKAWQEADNK